MKSHLVALVALAAFPVAAMAQAGPPPSPVIVPQPDAKLPIKHAPQPTTAAITAADLMTRLYIFADDSMQGREAGTIGNAKGTAYIAAELKRMGLKPAGDSGTYFQVLPFKVRSVDSSSVITAGDARLAFGREWGSTAP